MVSHLPTSLESLDLSSNPLETGTIPDFTPLIHLQHLNLFSTKRQGSLPTSHFPEGLESLYLTNNQLSGSISHSNFPMSLQILYLNDNSLREILSDFNQLENLSTLGLRTNQLIGSLVSGVNLPTSLHSLDLSDNALNRGVPDLSNLINLRDLYLEGSELIGFIPTSNLPTSLRRLHLHENSLKWKETISDFGKLNNLQKLCLYNNQLSDFIPPSHFPVSLRILDLSDNPINATISDFSRLTHLKYFSLSGTGLSDLISSSNFPTSLYVLFLSNNQLRWNATATNFSNFNELGNLSLYNNQLRGFIPISNFPTSLYQLTLSGNPLDTHVPDLSRLTNLKYLYLIGSQLNGSLSGSEFPTSLYSLHLDGNELEENLPDLSHLTNLNYLDLNNNQLGGSFDGSNLPTSLDGLNLSNNKLTGTIENLDTLTSLDYLNLSNNRLGGDIPDSLGALTGLGELYLDHNHLNGYIPLSLTKLTDLVSLDLGHNHLAVFDPAVLEFLEGKDPEGKDPDWESTQTKLLIACPNGGSVSIHPLKAITPSGKLNFGVELVGESRALEIQTRVEDCGDLLVDGLYLTGPDAFEFEIKDAGAPPVCYSGAWEGHTYSACQFTVIFSPTSTDEEAREAAINIGFNDLEVPPPSVPLEAKGLIKGEAKIEASLSEHDFGTFIVERAHSDLQRITLTNNGEINLEIEKIELVGTNTSDFRSYSYRCSSEAFLPPEAQCFVNTQFIPFLAGEKEANLNVISNAQDSPLEIPLTGTGVEPDDCSEPNITIASIGNGAWVSPETWNENRVPEGNDVVKIRSGHTVIGSPYVLMNTLCIEEGGMLTSADDQGTSLTVQAIDYLENKGSIIGLAGADESESSISCATDYWSAVGMPECAQPGASLYLSVGRWSATWFKNEGFISAGRGGSGKQYAAYGGDIGIYGGGLTNFSGNSGGIIEAGSGGNLTSSQTGQAGKGGDLSMLANDYLHHYGQVKIYSGNGGNCDFSRFEPQIGGNGGDIRLNAGLSVDLEGTFATGRGGINCSPAVNNGRDGRFNADPGVLKLSGAQTLIEGGDVTLYGGEGWALDLSGLNGVAVTATGSITLAVGEGGTIDLTGNDKFIFKAANQINIFSDSILLDDEVKLTDIFDAEKIVVGPSKILRDISLQVVKKLVGSPGASLAIGIEVSNGGPETDTYQLEVEQLGDWHLTPLSSSQVEVEGLSNAAVGMSVILPDQRGATNVLTITATSNSDPSVKATAKIPVFVAQGDPASSTTQLPSYRVLLTSARSFLPGEPQATVPVNFTLANQGSEDDKYVVEVFDTAGWELSSLPLTVDVKGLSTVDLEVNVTLPATRGETNVIKMTVTSLTDSRLKPSAETTVAVALEKITEVSTDDSTAPVTAAVVDSNTPTAATAGDPQPASSTPSVPDNTPVVANVSEPPSTTPSVVQPIDNSMLVVTSEPVDDGGASTTLTADDSETPVSSLDNNETSDSIMMEIPATVVSSPLQLLPDCPLTGVIDRLCKNYGQVITDATLTIRASVAGGEVAGLINNNGLLSSVGVQSGAQVHGGKMTGNIKNEGLIADFEFVGTQVEGGIVSGTVVNSSIVGGTFKNLFLAGGAYLVGGAVAGQIESDCENPAWLENLTVKAGSDLSCVILGNNVELAEGVTFENVSVAAPIYIKVGSFPTDQIDEGITLAEDVAFQDVDLAPNSFIRKGQLQGNILGDVSAPSLLEQVEIKKNSYLVGVILGEGVKLAKRVTLGKGVQTASFSD